MAPVSVVTDALDTDPIGAFMPVDSFVKKANAGLAPEQIILII